MNNNTKNIYMTIMLIGLVSLMGDIVYEGGRGLIPDYLEFLGASALTVGIIAGIGDFFGYALRLISGYLTDQKRTYWEFIFIGYGLIVSIPLLSISKGWMLAASLVILERVGKAIRSPARDTIVSLLSKGVGTGKAFGLHELFDQIGAISGPLIVSTVMYFTSNNYSLAFGTMFLPYFILLAILFFMYTRVKGRVAHEIPKKAQTTRRLSRAFYLYILSVTANVIGLISVSLILFKASIILNPLNQQWIVPLLFMLVQLVDAPSALLSGILFDRIGLKILLVPFAISIIPTLLVYQNSSLEALIVASTFFGIVLGMQESIYRAAVSSFAPIESRGTAYGIFNAAYGIGFLISGAIFGFFMDTAVALPIVLGYSVLLQIIAITLLLNSVRTSKNHLEQSYHTI
jgi:MFS family permease